MSIKVRLYNKYGRFDAGCVVLGVELVDCIKYVL